MQDPLDPGKPTLHLVIVSGLSGSGKTHAIKCFEDLGFFCVDNLPPALFQKFIELCEQQRGEIRHVALGIDIRERGFFADFFSNLERLKSLGHSTMLLFFEAQDEVLIRRFSESRRPHPMDVHHSVAAGIKHEREQLSEIRRRADQVIDTSHLTVHQLKELVSRQYGIPDRKQGMRLSLVTFGYKLGVPYDVDLVFDVRFLQNPNFDPELNPLTGEDPNVQRFVLETEEAKQFLTRLTDLLLFLLPLFERDHRSYLTIGIGCTGGRHRSVAVASRLQKICLEAGYHADLRHRDIRRS